MIMGDVNCRLGDLNENFNHHSFTSNPDVVVNSNGKRFIDVCKTHNLHPINHIATREKVFNGNFTFNRNNEKSQVDWVVVNSNCLPCIQHFSVELDCPQISDHKLLSLDYKLDISVPMSSTYESILDITRKTNDKISIQRMGTLMFSAIFKHLKQLR